MKTLREWGGLARPSRDPPQEPHCRDEVEGSSQYKPGSATAAGYVYGPAAGRPARARGGTDAGCSCLVRRRTRGLSATLGFQPELLDRAVNHAVGCRKIGYIRVSKMV